MRANPNDLLTRPLGFVKAGEQLHVTIGRNILGTPMALVDWNAFQNEVQDHLSALLHPSAVYGPFTGTGEWDGVPEDSATLSLTIGYTSRIEDVDAVLSTLANKYLQDAIAWTSGPGRLSRR